MTPLRAWSHACPAETWGVRGEGQAEAVRSREDVLVGVVAALLAFGLVFRNLQAVGSSPAMAVPKKDSFRLVSDYKAVNEQVQKSPGVMPNQEADIVDLLRARFYGKLDLLQGYWQMPLAKEARDFYDYYYFAWLVHPHACLKES